MLAIPAKSPGAIGNFLRYVPSRDAVFGFLLSLSSEFVAKIATEIDLLPNNDVN